MANNNEQTPVAVVDAYETAMQRIQSVPVGKTLIDSISDADWKSDESDEWNIKAGNTRHNDELDYVDLDEDQPKCA